MLLRELIEECLCRQAATGLYVLMTLTDTLNSILVVQLVCLQVVGQHLVKSISGALAAPPGKLLQLNQSLRLQRKGVHVR